MAEIAIKICGVTQPETLDLCGELGINMVGFVFFPASPRHLEDDQALLLARHCPLSLERVALLVDPSDDAIERALATTSPHRIQLHGHETPDRVAYIKSQFHIPVIKALSIGSIDDVKNSHDYAASADWLLFDAPAQNAALPGGNGKSFDWSILKAYEGSKPWVLSGGLTPENVQTAIAQTGAQIVDVSSGVESQKGVKDPDKIRAFCSAIRNHTQATADRQDENGRVS